MNILILVLSYNEPPYSGLMKAQQQTFDSIEVEGVRTVYYYGGGKGWVNDKEFSADSEDKYFYMCDKLLHCLKEVWDWDWQILFRSNSSSYISKQRLMNFAATLPTEKLYAGWTFHDSNSEDKGMCVSGSGIWLSRDTAEILRKDIDKDFEMEEDVYAGRILRKHGIVAIDDKSRYDVGEVVDAYPTTDRYHYRLKNGNRLQDAANFYKLHEKVK